MYCMRYISRVNLELIVYVNDLRNKSNYEK